MKRTLLDGLMKELDALAHECPEQPEWRELLDNVRKDTQMLCAPETYPPMNTHSTAPTSGQLCYVCEIAPSTTGASMCDECAAMYRPIGAMAVPGRCNCGHLPAEDKVYVYRKGGAEEALCGIECVKAHFSLVFGLFRGARRQSP